MYVGKGSEKRAVFHGKKFIRHHQAVNQKLLQWLQFLCCQNTQPQFCFLKKNVPVNRWKKWERYYITKWRKANQSLCNISDGGNAFTKEACQKGGLKGGPIGGAISGRNLFLSKRGLFAPGKQLEGAYKAGKKCKKLKLGFFAPGKAKEGGHIAGSMNSAKPGYMSRIGRIGGLIGGVIQGRKNSENGHLARANCVRWHVNRGIINSNCKFCQKPSKLKRFPRLVAP